VVTSVLLVTSVRVATARTLPGDCHRCLGVDAALGKQAF
jgi:hypothetical protein